MSDDRALPRYPVYVPSKGRSQIDLTTRELRRYSVPFWLVVEPQEEALYANTHPEDRLLVLPENNRGLIFARNWIRDHATASGAERHWQIDDNIRHFARWYRKRRMYCHAGIALRATEDFTDRYANVGIAGLNYVAFAPFAQVPFRLNVHVYSCTLMLNSLPYRFRPPANEDVDMCLQVLAGGWCTIQMNAFLIQKIATMKVRGGQTDTAYRGDGRLFMARSLERAWPGVVTTVRRFERPQHKVHGEWGAFDTPLQLKPGVDLSQLPAVDNYGMTLKAMQPIKAASLRAVYERDRAQAEE